MWEVRSMRFVKCYLSTLSWVASPSLRFVWKGKRLFKLQGTHMMPIKYHKAPWWHHSYADGEYCLLRLGRCRYNGRIVPPTVWLSLITLNPRFSHYHLLQRSHNMEKPEVCVQMNCAPSLTMSDKLVSCTQETWRSTSYRSMRWQDKVEQL